MPIEKQKSPQYFVRTNDGAEREVTLDTLPYYGNILSWNLPMVQRGVFAEMIDHLTKMAKIVLACRDAGETCQDFILLETLHVNEMTNAMTFLNQNVVPELTIHFLKTMMQTVPRIGEVMSSDSVVLFMAASIKDGLAKTC